MMKTSRYKGLVLGSFLARETDLIFGDRVGVSLIQPPHCQLGVGLCDVDAFLHWNSEAEEGAWVGLKRTSATI